MDIISGFEPEGVGSIPAGPASCMLLTPVSIKHQITLNDKELLVGNKIPIRLTPSKPILEQLDLIDLKNDVYVYAAIMGPKSKIKVHKDDQYPVKWTLIIPPVGHEDVDIEIVSIKERAIPESEKIGLTPIGTPVVSFKDEDCILLESWNLRFGACYFNPTDHWHRAVNNTEEPRIVYSLRSTSIEIDEILKRIA